MKKYVKPDLFYENFEMSHTVANCNPSMGHSKTTCKYDSDELLGLLDDGETVFTDSNCTMSWAKFTSEFNNYCLQTGSEDYVLFTS